MARTASSNTSFLVSMSRPNGVNSVIEALSPIPNSQRPLLSRSSTAMRSATRAGWLVVSWKMPWPKETSRKAQKSSTDFRFPILKQPLDLVGEHVPQRRIALTFGIVFDAVFLAEIGDGDDGVAHLFKSRN